MSDETLVDVESESSRTSTSEERGGKPPPRGTSSAATAWRRTKRFLTWFPVAVLLFWTFLPFLMTISISLKNRATVLADRGLIPNRIDTSGYEIVLASEGFRTALMNTVFLGITTLILTLVLAVPAAYAFSKFNFRGRNLALVLTLLPLLVPKVGLMLPLYRMASFLGMLNSYITLTVVFAGTLMPLATWLLVGFFRAIPKDLEESAAVDGASLWQRLRKIMLPLALPALITVGILCFREAWTEFDLVLALTSDSSKRTLPYELFNLSETAGLPNYPAEAAFAILTVVPFILVYARIERYVTQGFLSGSVK